MPLNTSPNFTDPDGVYELLTEAHRGLDAAASAAFNARLLLLLANHIGDAAIIRQAITIATIAAPDRLAINTPFST